MIILLEENGIFGGGGKVTYKGKAFGGTNFIGPGPDKNPSTLGLEPVDELDFAAYIHDKVYFRFRTGGIDGAKYNLDVAFADLQLVNHALSIIERYKVGGFDEITEKKISERTYNLAIAVYMYFEPKVRNKYWQLGKAPNIQYPWLGK